MINFSKLSEKLYNMDKKLNKERKTPMITGIIKEVEGLCKDIDNHFNNLKKGTKTSNEALLERIYYEYVFYHGKLTAYLYTLSLLGDSKFVEMIHKKRKYEFLKSGQFSDGLWNEFYGFVKKRLEELK